MRVADSRARRLVTVPLALMLAVVITIVLPLLVVVAVVVDAVRWAASRKPAVSVRLLLFLWVYLLGQMWALIALLAVSALGRTRSRAATFRLQQAWGMWNFQAVRLLFGLRFRVEGEDSITPGPIVLIARHASMIDTLLPVVVVSRPTGMRLRYVLKKELLVDPALDVAGNRLPNYFVDRGSANSETERSKIRALARDLRADDGILIYPEGTRYSEAKRVRFAARLAKEDGRVGEVARSLRHLLPPRPGGTLAILDATDADVVVMAHTGLEGFATARDVWNGDLIGSTIVVSLRRIAWADIPSDRQGRITWLFEVWAAMDEWIETTREAARHRQR